MASNRKFSHFFRRYLLLAATAPVLFLLFLSGGVATAQIVKSTFIGTVRDTSGAVVPGATITVRNLETNVTNVVPTDNTGDYIVPFLNSGLYSVTAEKSGFEKTTEPSIKLDVASKVRVDLVLHLGQTTQTIEVHAATPLVQTDTSTVDTVLGTEQLRQLPLVSRNYQELTLIAPGAVGVIRGNPAEGYVGGQTTGDYYQTAGQRGAFIDYTVDGINDNNVLMQTQSLIPSLDSIGEFKVETHNFSAEYGRGTVQFVVTTRAGVNTLHGSAYEFVKNNIMDSTDYFTNETAGKKQVYRHNQFGGTLGGPVVLPKVYDGKDKTFFFFGYEGTRYVSSSTAYARWPMPEWLTGNFSDLTDAQGNPVTIYDPATTQCNTQGVCTRQAFPGNIIPQNRIDPVALAAIPFIPAPEQRADLPGMAGVANTEGPIHTTSSPNYWNLRLDHNISDKDRIYARYMQSNEYTPTSSLAPMSGDFITNRGKNMMFAHTHMFSPTIVNELRLGYNRSNYGNLQEGADGQCITSCKDIDYVHQVFGLHNTGAGPLTWGIPNFIPTYYSSIGGPVDDPYRPLTNNYQISDNLIVTRGHHSMKMGIDFQKTRFNMIWGTWTRGGFAFNGDFTNNGTAGQGGSDIADFLLGFADTTYGDLGQISGVSHQKTYGLYFQDDYRVRPNLTLNLGLRYEFYGPWSEQNGKYVVFDFGSPPGQCFGDNCPPGHLESIPPNKGLYNDNWGDWGPRIGLSYSPFGNNKTAIRASYGIFYTPPDINDVVWTFFNPPDSFAWLFEPNNPYTDLTTTKMSLSFPNVPFQNLPASSWVTNNWPGPAISLYTDPKAFPDAAVNEWELNVQRQLKPDVLLEVGYMGSHGYHGQLRIDYNQARLDYPGQITPITSRLPYPALSSYMFAVAHEDNSSYNALTVRLEKRFSHGFSVLNAFTWSKTLDDYGNLNDSTGFWAQNAYNLNAEWGLTSFDTPYRFTSGYVLEVPYGRGKRWGSQVNPIVDGFIGGWQVSGITTFQTGTPIVPRPTVETSNTGTFNWTDRVNQVAPVQYMNIRKTGDWFNANAFVQPPLGTFGTAARGDLMGPGINNWDLSLAKSFRIKERAGLQFRAEFYNGWNHAQFLPNGVNTNIYPAGSPGPTGHVSSDYGPRTMQMGLRLQF